MCVPGIAIEKLKSETDTMISENCGKRNKGLTNTQSGSLPVEKKESTLKKGTKNR